jgi:hypothetical protein
MIFFIAHLLNQPALSRPGSAGPIHVSDDSRLPREKGSEGCAKHPAARLGSAISRQIGPFSTNLAVSTANAVVEAMSGIVELGTSDSRFERIIGKSYQGPPNGTAGHRRGSLPGKKGARGDGDNLVR